MPTFHRHPWHKGSVYGDGPRQPLCRERRAVWKCRLELHRRAGRITALQAHVALALLKRLGQDGRCDPSHVTLAADAGVSVNTVKRSLRSLATRCGMLTWARRIVRAGRRVVQTSSAYLLTLGQVPVAGADRCEGQSGRGIIKQDLDLPKKRRQMTDGDARMNAVRQLIALGAPIPAAWGISAADLG